MRELPKLVVQEFRVRDMLVVEATALVEQATLPLVEVEVLAAQLPTKLLEMQFQAQAVQDLLSILQVFQYTTAVVVVALAVTQVQI